MRNEVYVLNRNGAMVAMDSQRISLMDEVIASACAKASAVEHHLHKGCGDETAQRGYLHVWNGNLIGLKMIDE